MDAPSPVFALEQVTVRRDGRLLLDGIRAEIPAATCTALVGPSGAGKSTLLRLLNRLAEPTSGVVRFHGTPLPHLDVLGLRRQVGLVGQQPVLLTDHVLDDLRAGNPKLTEDGAAALLERGLPVDILGRATAGLFGGEAQRVCLARALGPVRRIFSDQPAALGARLGVRPSRPRTGSYLGDSGVRPAGMAGGTSRPKAGGASRARKDPPDRH